MRDGRCVQDKNATYADFAEGVHPAYPDWG